MTTTPKDPVDALMELVDEAISLAFERDLSRAIKVKVAVEASARALAAVPASPSSPVYLVATGEVHEGQETYTRHEARPPLCDAETLYTSPQQAGGVPAGFVAVPLSFVQGFHTLAHNYSLRAVPPDYYRGVDGDAFSAAYKRCGADLAKLRDMLAAAPSPSAVQPLSEAQRNAGFVEASRIHGAEIEQLRARIEADEALLRQAFSALLFSHPNPAVQEEKQRVSKALRSRLETK